VTRRAGHRKPPTLAGRRFTLLARDVEIHVDGKRSDLFQQHIERFGHTRLHAVVTIHDVLVHLGATGHIVRFDREHFLQGVGGTVRFQCPDLHLPEALTTELGLTAQRLLGNQAVGAGGARVHLVVHKGITLQHIHHTNGDLAIEGVSGAPVIKCDLATFIQASQLQHFLDLGLVGTIKYRRGHRHTVAQVMSELHDLIIIQLIKIFLATAYLVVDFIKKLAHFGYLLLLFQHQVDAFTQALRCRTEVSLQYLTHVHTRRYAERIQYDVDRVALFVVGHVFNRHDDGNDTLV